MSSQAQPEEYEGTELYQDAQPENRLGIDPVTGNFRLMAKGEDDALTAIDAMRQLRTLYPIDQADIAYEPGWPRHEDGRPLSVLEATRQQQHLTPNENVL